MSRYRRIDVRTWADRQFRALSRPGPSAQYLWLYLNTGPHTTILPGLFEAGMAGIAERLKWPYEDAERCFQEIFSHGMAQFDHDALIFWIPKGIASNLPSNQNVIKSWRSAWDELPQSLLKYSFLDELKDVIEQLKLFELQDGKGITRHFYEHFPEICTSEGQGLAKPHPYFKRVGLAKPQRRFRGVGLANTGTVTGTGKEEEKEKKNKKEKEEEVWLPLAAKEAFDEFCN